MLKLLRTVLGFIENKSKPWIYRRGNMAKKGSKAKDKAAKYRSCEDKRGWTENLAEEAESSRERTDKGHLQHN